MNPTPEAPRGSAPRPRQVTLAASLVMAASVLLVLSVFERLGDLRSLESRTAIERFLSQPPGSDLGVGLESVMTILRTVSMVAAGLATATAILGWHVLKRNRSARVGLTVLALPLFVSGLVAGGFLASVVAASVAMLWLAPARHWFDGTAPPSTTVRRGASASPDLPAAPTAPPHVQQPPQEHAPPTQQPGPWQPPFGDPSSWPPYAGPPAWTPSVPAQGPATATRRPGSLVAACVITWVCCAFTVLLSLLLVAVLASDAEGLVAEMHRQNPELSEQGLSDATLRSATWVMALVLLSWAALSGVLALLAYLRIRWAAIALVVSAGAVALFCVAASLLSPPLVVPGLLAAAAAGLLLQPSAQRWLARREAPAARP